MVLLPATVAGKLRRLAAHGAPLEAWAILSALRSGTTVRPGRILAAGVGNRFGVFVPVPVVLSHPDAAVFWHHHPEGPEFPSVADLEMASLWPSLVFVLRGRRTWSAWDCLGPRPVIQLRSGRNGIAAGVGAAPAV